MIEDKIIEGIQKCMIKSRIGWIVREAYKNEKGRSQPFWTKQWRKR